MINFEGANYFKITIEEVELNDAADYRRMILFNIMSDPSDVVDIELYKKTPIASIIFSYDKDDYRYDSDLSMFLSKSTEELALFITRRTARAYSTFSVNSAEYKYIRDSIPETKIHSTLFVFNMSNGERHPKNIDNFVIAAIPCRGIITPLKKSKAFELYNGEFVVTNSFDTDFGYQCNRIVYMLAKVKSHIVIEEYYHEPGEYVGLCTTHTIGGLQYTAIDSLAAYDEYVANNSSKWELMTCVLDSKIEHFIVPYDGNESLFKKTGGNIFSIGLINRPGCKEAGNGEYSTVVYTS